MMEAVKVTPIRSTRERPLLVGHRWLAYAFSYGLCGFTIAAGWITAQYPPDFFNYPVVWGAAFGSAGLVGALCVTVPRWPTVTMWAGAVMAGLATARGLFIAETVPLSDWAQLISPWGDPPVEVSVRSASRALATLQWLTLSMLIFITWPPLIHDTQARGR